MNDQLRMELRKQVPEACSLTAERRGRHFDFHICTPFLFLQAWEVPDPLAIRRCLKVEGRFLL